MIHVYYRTKQFASRRHEVVMNPSPTMALRVPYEHEARRICSWKKRTAPEGKLGQTCPTDSLQAPYAFPSDQAGFRF